MTYLQNSSNPFAQMDTGGNQQLRDMHRETRVDRCGNLTFHLFAHDTAGSATEKVYNENNQLCKVIKRSGNSKSETYVNPVSGQRRRITEHATMPDGNLLGSDLIYHDDNRSSQVVSIVKPNGILVRLVEREIKGSLVIYQGQTDYDIQGTPSITVNHHTDPDTRLLMHREQIHWMAEGKRAMSENFYFDTAGSTVRYVKRIYHAEGGVFSQETQEFESSSRQLVRRELSAFNPAGQQTSHDAFTYKADGQVWQRESTFFNAGGHPIVTRRSIP